MRSSVKLLLSAGILIAVLASALVGGSVESNVAQKVKSSNDIAMIRVGHFPNINHAAAIVGLARGTFKEALPDLEIKTTLFNAGPSAIEALFAGQIDITYIGPNPSINGYIKSNGKAVKIIAGAASGGAVFVVRDNVGIDSASDFHGKRFVSPQLGNTQDVALRAYIQSKGYELAEKGGTVRVQPVANPDILTLFLKKELDGAWVPEPWGARLVKEAGGKILVDERELWPNGEFVTANVLVRTEFLKEHPDVVEKWLKAHVETILWVNANKEEASKIVNGEIKRLTGQGIDQEILQEALSRMKITYDPVKQSLIKSADDAFKLGYLGDKRPDLSNIYDLSILNKVLHEKRLPIIG